MHLLVQDEPALRIHGVVSASGEAPVNVCSLALMRLRRIHAPWVESEARVAAARGAAVAGQLCERLTQQSLPGPVRQAIANALMEGPLWRKPVTQPRVIER